MNNWNHKLEVGDVWEKAKKEEIDIQELSRQIIKRLKKISSYEIDRLNKKFNTNLTDIDKESVLYDIMRWEDFNEFLVDWEGDLPNDKDEFDERWKWFYDEFADEEPFRIWVETKTKGIS